MQRRSRFLGRVLALVISHTTSWSGPTESKVDTIKYIRQSLDIVENENNIVKTQDGSDAIANSIFRQWYLGTK